MVKSKSSKGDGSNIPQKHLHSRLSFLHQAATLLATTTRAGASADAETGSSTKDLRRESTTTQLKSEATRLLTQIRGVSRKSQIRLGPKFKHTFCKRCDSLLIPGRTSSESIVNASKDSKKPWADIFEIRCSTCGTIKRFPVGQCENKPAEPELTA
ncbi:RNAse P Rpr2/Rpp21/SNM1 subunit domain-containing protein [Exophiala viscosa]|uniref:RNAse P Rpr2/Rpp21/SNM1 subunit domain-containing protein n=1 Tax=Exophiala viscosa TaxID=2486360 RepID=A0AAN6DZ60_9EURO|nr:RNAse P Rpr2/Rpp21/SNM1 subunit domain-containing protein [Exophiala viscosa]KAI1622353.1 RNAse P Rpr2/Rpp21/SNM1 subunit domain-containing protein [Exophiala viscosa]